MMTLAILSNRIFAVQVVGGDIHLAANDGFDAFFLGFDKKFHCAIHHSVISQGNRVHSKFLGTINQVIYFSETIQERIMGVDVEMSEFHNN